jgi:hypothetical protein
MSKFKVRLSIKEFSLEVEGSREDLPQISHNLTRQLTGFVAPATTPMNANVLPLNGHDKSSTSPASPRRSFSRGRNPTSKEDKRVDWTYDGQAYGMPRQNWTAIDKAIWLLHVAKKALGINEMAAAQIVTTFNSHYASAKPISMGNLSRDLHKLRVLPQDAPVAQNGKAWLLTQLEKTALRI